MCIMCLSLLLLRLLVFLLLLLKLYPPLRIFLLLRTKLISLPGMRGSPPCFVHTVCSVISWIPLLLWIHLVRILLLRLCRFYLLILRLPILLLCPVGGLRIMLHSTSWYLRSGRFRVVYFLLRIWLPGLPCLYIRHLSATMVPAAIPTVRYF